MLAALTVAALGQTTGCIFVSDTARGQFGVTWVVTLDDVPVDCAAVGATTVEVDVTPVGSTDLVVKEVPCSAGGLTTDKFDAGDYTVTVNLLDSAGIPMTDSATFTATIVNNGDLVALPEINFAFESFRLSFDVRMGDSTVHGDNCDSTNAPVPGAGVVQEEVLFMDRVGGLCLPVAISGLIDENNLPLVADTCEQVVCQPRSVVHQINGLTSGTYIVQVIGYKGAIGSGTSPCYVSDLHQITLINDADIGTIEAPFDDSADPQGCNATKSVSVASR
jgi:hypothetical protein